MYVEDSFHVSKFVNAKLTHVVHVLLGSDKGQETRLFFFYSMLA